MLLWRSLGCCSRCTARRLTFRACRRIGRLDPGQYFGEVSCWTGTRRTASVVAITTSELFSLERVSLLAIAVDWPEITNELNFKTPEPKPREKEQRTPLEHRLTLSYAFCSSGALSSNTHKVREMQLWYNALA